MERKMNLYGNHIFELLRIIDKLGLTEELSNMFKNIVKNADKEKSLTARLRIALGDKEYTEDNIMKVLSNNKELAKAYAEQQENKIDKTMDILGILIKRIPQAEDEVQALLKEQKVDTSKITFNYSNEASDLVSLMATGKLTTGIVPEPALSGLLAKNSNLKVICAVNDVWKDVYKYENGYPQSTLLVNTSFVKENKEFVESFVKALDENINWTNKNPKEAGEYASKFGVSLKPELLVKAIDRTNLKFISAKDSKEDYTNYFKILNSFNPKVLGGSIPKDDIFYLSK